MRFTLGKMFLAVAVLAIAFAGMKYRTGLWASSIFTLTLVVFAFAVLQAIRLSARGRIAAAVFAVAGTAYLLLATTAVFNGPRQLLVTNYPLAWALTAIQSSAVQTPTPYPPGDDPFAPMSPFDVPDPFPNWSVETTMQFVLSSSGENRYPLLYNFFVIGHCVFSWLFAMFAGWVAGRMYDRRKVPTAV